MLPSGIRKAQPKNPRKPGPLGGMDQGFLLAAAEATVPVTATEPIMADLWRPKFLFRKRNSEGCCALSTASPKTERLVSRRRLENHFERKRFL